MINAQIQLTKLLSTYQDLELENWLIWHYYLTHKGLPIFLNNPGPITLAAALKWQTNNLSLTTAVKLSPHLSSFAKPSGIEENNFFFALDNLQSSIRPYLHKGVVFNYKNNYRIWINQDCLIKPLDLSWLEWSESITIPPHTKLIIQEIPQTTWLKEIIKVSYLDSADTYYQFLQNQITISFPFTYLKYLNQWLHNLKVPLKITKSNQQHFLTNFQVSQISQDLVFLSLLAKRSSHYLFEVSGKLPTFMRSYEERHRELLKFNLWLTDLINQPSCPQGLNII